MNYLGSSRIITSSYASHVTAEDYAGDHLSKVLIYGKGRVIKVVNKFKSHEDSINYNDFMINQNNWKVDNIYNCISITGKTVQMTSDELGGNQIYIETYDNGQSLTLRVAHLDTVYVNVGDIVDENTVLGLQGNTGLVLSNKDRSNVTYGSHVHLEITNSNGNFINPRDYSNGNIKTTYLSQSNDVDSNKSQIKINVDKINIRNESDETSIDLGDVYLNEVYTVLDTVDSNLYTWYKITTNLGVTGFVASKKGENWITLTEPAKLDDDKSDSVKPDGEVSDDAETSLKLIFTCEKDDTYYLKLNKGEKLYIETNK